jgi:signal transduction histidine kinase
MEGELLRREQLAAVGELAATIAHEVRNPLAIILNATAGLRRGALGEPDRQMLLGIVEEEVGRLNRLVADLLRFARPVAVSWGDVNLRELVERTRSLVPPEIAVEVDIPEERRLETVTLDAGLLRLGWRTWWRTLARRCRGREALDRGPRRGARGRRGGGHRSTRYRPRHGRTQPWSERSSRSSARGRRGRASGSPSSIGSSAPTAAP